jgi:hypothetical protein
VATEQNNTALEFEATLRRYLKSGGAPVVACAGFDFDTASAYLEGALVKKDRASYESHLADCAACRRHLIELSRLAQAVSQTGKTPAVVADQSSVWGPVWSLTWGRWREAVAGWFDLSGWNLNWRMAGVGAAALAILVATLSLQSWRQDSRDADGAIALNTAPSAEPQFQTPAPQPSPPSQEEAPVRIAENYALVDQKNLRASVPEPSPAFGPKEEEANVTVAASGESLKPNSAQSGGTLQFSFNSKQETPADVQRGGVELPRTSDAQPVLVADSAEVGRQVLAKEREIVSPVLAERDETRSNDITARMTPPPGINPMRLPRSRSQAENSSVPSRLYEIASAFARRDKSTESRRKAELEPLDDESFKPLIVRIRDKVFRFEKDMWIDQAYKPEMQWRVLKLTRGSKQYEQVLSNDPSLKEFFDHGPMIIVWKDKIYKVR